MKNILLTLVIFSATSAFAKSDFKQEALDKLELIKAQEYVCLESPDGQSTVGAENCAFEKKQDLTKLLKKVEHATKGKETSTQVFHRNMERVLAEIKAEDDWKGGTGQGRAVLNAYNDETEKMILKLVQE